MLHPSKTPPGSTTPSTRWPWPLRQKLPRQLTRQLPMLTKLRLLPETLVQHHQDICPLHHHRLRHLLRWGLELEQGPSSCLTWATWSRLLSIHSGSRSRRRSDLHGTAALGTLRQIPLNRILSPTSRQPATVQLLLLLNLALLRLLQMRNQLVQPSRARLGSGGAAALLLTRHPPAPPILKRKSRHLGPPPIKSTAAGAAAVGHRQTIRMKDRKEMEAARC